MDDRKRAIAAMFAADVAALRSLKDELAWARFKYTAVVPIVTPAERLADAHEVTRRWANGEGPEGLRVVEVDGKPRFDLSGVVVQAGRCVRART